MFFSDICFSKHTSVNTSVAACDEITLVLMLVLRSGGLVERANFRVEIRGVFFIILATVQKASTEKFCNIDQFNSLLLWFFK